jgi:hypothetical protein
MVFITNLISLGVVDPLINIITFVVDLIISFGDFCNPSPEHVDLNEGIASNDKISSQGDVSPVSRPVLDPSNAVPKTSVVANKIMNELFIDTLNHELGNSYYNLKVQLSRELWHELMKPPGGERRSF